MSKIPVEELDIDHYTLLEDFTLNSNVSADGSAYLEYGDVKVFCAVNGPSEHQFPRGKYEIAALILDDGGSKLSQPSTTENCLAAAITCAGLALADAGVQMYDTVVAVSFDASSIAPGTSGNLCTALLPSLRQISMFSGCSIRIHPSNGRGKPMKSLLDHALGCGVGLASVIRAHLCEQQKVVNK